MSWVREELGLVKAPGRRAESSVARANPGAVGEVKLWEHRGDETMILNDKASYSWHPIEDYETDPQELGKPELRSLAEVWNEQCSVLMEAEGLQQFNERLKREWAIETGLIERLYTFDRGITQTLIERGIDAALIPHQTIGEDPERIVAKIRDHEDALDGLFAFVKSDLEKGAPRALASRSCLPLPGPISMVNSREEVATWVLNMTPRIRR